MTKQTLRAGWRIYIPEEGHWPIPGLHKNLAEAKKAYLKWAGRKTLPKGSFIDNAYDF